MKLVQFKFFLQLFDDSFSISGWGRQRGGGNRNGGRYQKPKISKEELDSELDSYMKHTKTVLDKDLDDYMAQGDMSK
jgi:hypothetical protein